MGALRADPRRDLAVPGLISATSMDVVMVVAQEVVIDSCRRWMAAHDTPVADSCNIASTLSCTLIETGKITRA